MSTTDNTSNFDNNPADVYEDELLTWLQYPADDAFERNYCSDAFGGVLPLPNVELGKAHSDLHPPARHLSDMGLDAWTGSGSLRLTPLKANVGGPKSVSTPSSDAENALALGAARAAGHSSPAGHHAFSRVRTSMQPQSIKTMACDSFKALDYKDCSVLTPKMLVPNASKQAQESPQLHIANSFTSKGKSKNAPSGFTSLVTEQSGKVQEMQPQQQTHTQQSRLKHIAEGETIGRVNGKHAISCRSAEANGATATSSNSVSAKAKAGWSDQTSEIIPSYSGGSQTSMSLSFMEASYGGKRTHEVLELQSEDTDDKMREVKVPRNSSSRRNRISHVHNLSEKNRRNKINEKLKALQDLIPNSSKTDKASVLDEAIEYMKTLQLQLQMVSTRSNMNLNMPSILVPIAFPSTPIQMPPFSSIGLGVPCGPVGLQGMGVNAQMQLLSQNDQAAPFLPAPSAMTPYGMLLKSGKAAFLQDSSKAFLNSGLLPTHLSASMQTTLEPSEYVLSKSRSSSYAHHCQQQKQGQQLGHPFLDNNENKEQEGLSD